MTDEQVEIDTTVAHPARVYDYWIGGKDNYAPDRELAEKMIAQVPAIPMMARANRDFLGRAVRYLVVDRGVRQFLDIGSGIPTASNVHQVAQAVDPSVRVVYADNDPIVLAHSRALLTSTPEGRTAFVAGDARSPQAILEKATATLDLDRPIGLMLISLLMYFELDEAAAIVATLMDALPAGSTPTISHPTGDFDPDAATRANATAAGGGITYRTRSREQIAQLFDGLDMVAPGLVPMLSWRPDVEHPNPRSVYYWVGMGVKP